MGEAKRIGRLEGALHDTATWMIKPGNDRDAATIRNISEDFENLENLPAAQRIAAMIELLDNKYKDYEHAARLSGDLKSIPTVDSVAPDWKYNDNIIRKKRDGKGWAVAFAVPATLAAMMIPASLAAVSDTPEKDAQRNAAVAGMGEEGPGYRDAKGFVKEVTGQPLKRPRMTTLTEPYALAQALEKIEATGKLDEKETAELHKHMENVHKYKEHFNSLRQLSAQQEDGQLGLLVGGLMALLSMGAALNFVKSHLHDREITQQATEQTAEFMKHIVDRMGESAARYEQAKLEQGAAGSGQSR